MSMAKNDRKARQLAARKIRRDLAAIEPSACHQQEQSPLFGILPPELRNLIFALAMREEQDETHTYYYHVCETTRRKLHFSWPATKQHLDLMQTCRLVYHETESLPLQTRLVVCCFTDGEVYGSTKASTLLRSPLLFHRLTWKHQEQLREVHLITPCHDFANTASTLTLPQFAPRILNLSLGWINRKFLPFTAVPFNNQLEELHIRAVELRWFTGHASINAHIQAKPDQYKITRKDGRQLCLVQSKYEVVGCLKDSPLDWATTHFTWGLQNGRPLCHVRAVAEITEPLDGDRNWYSLHFIWRLHKAEDQ